MSELELPVAVVRQQIASAIDFIVQIGRLRDGSRRVLAVTEVVGMEAAVISTHDLFTFQQSGTAAGGGILGRFKPTGIPAKLFQELRGAGYEADFRLFQVD